MKKFLLVFLLYATPLLAADKILNGGNAVVCSPGSNNPHIELLDYYELRLNGGKLSLQGNDHIEMLKNLFAKWKKIAPERMALYSQWLTDFKDEVGLYSGITIPAIPDTGSIAIPQGCELKPIGFQRADSDVLPGVKRYVISKDLWDLMPEIQKAGLVLHELIYREGIKAKHSSSFPTRYLNGYLSSAIPDSKSYSSIGSRLPFRWVEYGGGMVLNTYGINEYEELCTISKEGYFAVTIAYPSFGVSYDECGMNKIIDDVITDNFRLIGIQFSEEEKFHSREFAFNKDSLSFELPQYIKGINQVFIKSKDFSFDFSIAEKNQISRIAIESMKKKYRESHFTIISLSNPNEELSVSFNPEKSWFINGKDELVEGITNITFVHGGAAMTIFTAKGEVWKWNGLDYIRQP